MRISGEKAPEVIVEHDPERVSIDIRFGTTAGDESVVVHLTREEARRLAALILFSAARIDPPLAGWCPEADSRRMSA